MSEIKWLTGGVLFLSVVILVALLVNGCEETVPADQTGVEIDIDAPKIKTPKKTAQPKQQAPKAPPTPVRTAAPKAGKK